MFCQLPFGDNLSALSKGSVEQSSNLDLPCDIENILFEKITPDSNLAIPYQFDTHLDQQDEKLVQDNLEVQYTNIEPQSSMGYKPENNISIDGNVNYAFTLRQQLLDGEEGLKKVDSFSRWISKELGEVDLQMQSPSGIPWNTDENGNVVDDSSLSPSISHDQLFTIIDFSPKWAFIDSEPEVFNVFIYSNEKLK